MHCSCAVCSYSEYTNRCIEVYGDWLQSPDTLASRLSTGDAGRLAAWMLYSSFGSTLTELLQLDKLTSLWPTPVCMPVLGVSAYVLL